MRVLLVLQSLVAQTQAVSVQLNLNRDHLGSLILGTALQIDTKALRRMRRAFTK
jgi:hypothetical protein